MPHNFSSQKSLLNCLLYSTPYRRWYNPQTWFKGPKTPTGSLCAHNPSTRDLVEMLQDIRVLHEVKQTKLWV